MTKAIMLNIYQPTAHYRNPQVSQDDFISTLELPSPTTVVGMLAYLCDCKFSEEIKIGIIGTHQSKEVHFIRGEMGNFWHEYLKFTKKIEESERNSGKMYQHFKNKIISNRIMNFEVLREVELTVFIQASEELLEKILKELHAPKRYASLGRKEDFVMFGKMEKGKFLTMMPEIVEIETIVCESVGEAIEQKVKLKNTYVPIPKEETATSEKILAAGTIYSLAYSYANLNAPKKERRMLKKQYVYIQEGLYISKMPVNQYKTWCFQWM